MAPPAPPARRRALAVFAAFALLLLGHSVAQDSPDVVDTLLREQFPANYDGSNVHIVFSNGCGQKNRLLFATVLQQSATRVGQKGPITQALEYYSGVGPPYIMTRRDFESFIDDYCNFTVEGRKVSDEWMTEMFGYSVAAANHGIKHTILTNMAPTHPYLNGHEYWSFLYDESLKKNPCEDPYELVMPADPPVGIHYFHYYMLLVDGRQFHKGAIPAKILKCDHEMLEVPKAAEYDAVFTTYADNPGYMAQKRVEVWTECTLIKAVNAALMALKSATCDATGFNSYQGVVMLYEKSKE
ncbi:hypothetical protein PybrP1_012315 [[Pythium] brassicae (nom. inval.)]|nr:hypothetical protein PybrP1_012315 [[Pythium] brassicae (nom. inval.)]